MHNVWVLNLRAQPPAVVGHFASNDLAVLVRAAGALAHMFPGPEFTLVHQVNSEPLGIEER